MLEGEEGHDAEERGLKRWETRLLVGSDGKAGTWKARCLATLLAHDGDGAGRVALTLLCHHSMYTIHL